MIVSLAGPPKADACLGDLSKQTTGLLDRGQTSGTMVCHGFHCCNILAFRRHYATLQDLNTCWFFRTKSLLG